MLFCLRKCSNSCQYFSPDSTTTSYSYINEITSVSQIPAYWKWTKPQKIFSLAHNTKLLQRLTLCLRPAHLHHCIIYLFFGHGYMLLLGLESSSSGPQQTRQWWWGLILEAGQGRVQSWEPDGFHCSEAPLQPRGDTLALQSHNQNNWEQDGKRWKKGMNIFDGRQPCLKERTGACIHQAGSLQAGLRYTTTSLQCDSRVNTQ